MPNKLTDSEIKKGLERCLGDSCYSSECSFFEEIKDGEHCQRVAIKYALDLIDRQQAELEDLREIVFTDRTEAYKLLKAEAYKECIKKVKKKLENMCLAEDAYVPYPFTFLDNLLKELVGEK